MRNVKAKLEAGIYSQTGTKHNVPDGGMLLVAFVPHGYHRLKPVGKNHRANSAKLDTKQPWENGIQGYLNEGPCHFSRGYKKKKRKYIYLAKVRNSFL